MSAVVQRPAVAARPRPRSRAQRLLTSSIGLKFITALTGAVLSLFVLGHMVGNLQVFQGPEALNAYAKLLRVEPALLWTARTVLLASVGLHIWAYLALTRQNMAARAEGYREVAHKESSFASRSMRVTGPLLLAFIVYHVLHLTTGTVHPDFREGDVYRNLVSGLRVVPVGLIYILAMLALGFHLWHGVWSLFQTLGAGQARYHSLGRRFATVFTVVVVAGFAAVPLAALAGLLKVPGSGAP
jgi:succinate dehydrogenase / fumarate reductase cytochrome b subunit